ncbi:MULTISPECIES: hypothetical protein [unclassified Nocardia]|uniref:hypothetical protein n=1 Tax=unclassified Nocardia TaxID=2637762 RepID=UPI0024A9DA50|nr:MULTISPECIES: hypothetical protein [unclassified Nocardia]
MVDAAFSAHTAVPNESVVPLATTLPVDSVLQERVTVCCDRLVRHLFDAGLRLHTLRTLLERDDATDSLAGRSAVDEVLDDLDRVIRDAGLTMLAVIGDHDPTGLGNGRGPTPARRRRR